MISKQTLGTVAAVVGIAVVMGLGVFALSTVPVNGQSAPGASSSSPAPVSTKYAAPSILDAPQGTPVATDTPASTAPAAPAAPAPAPATPVVAPAPAATATATATATPAPKAITAPVVVAPAPVKCPAGSSANSNDGTNDTSCYPDICLSPGMVIPDPAHPECNAPFKP